LCQVSWWVLQFLAKKGAENILLELINFFGQKRTV
jgi:hypothetical protein